MLISVMHLGGFCKKLKPEWEKACSDFETIKMGKVDCDKNPDIAQRFGVTGFPTIIAFKEGELIVNYEGPHESTSILEYIDQLLRTHKGGKRKKRKSKVKTKKIKRRSNIN